MKQEVLAYLDQLYVDQPPEFVYFKTLYHIFEKFLADEDAARILKSDFVGVDLIMSDPSAPLDESGGVINEVNTTPALHHHYDINVERFPEPAVEALSLLLNRAQSSLNL